MSDTPLALGADVTLIRSLPASDGPMRVPINSLVIAGSEPVLVDCGAAAGREEWWRQVEEAVDPVEVRWIFLSHDDIDHTGNLAEALERCPSATVVASWLLDQRLAAGVPIPRHRCRWINDGESFDAGGRRLVALRPPVYDAPTTRGLFDVTSGVYWGADCFGLPVPYAADEVADLDRDVWEDGLRRFQLLVSPWVTEVDPLRWRTAIGRVEALGPTVLASAHGPVIRRRYIDRALDVLGELPGLPQEPVPGQDRLESILASAHAP